jgi:hypothetical protein
VSTRVLIKAWDSLRRKVKSASVFKPKIIGLSYEGIPLM